MPEGENKDNRVLTFSSETEVERRRRMLELFRSVPIPDDELLAQLGMFARRQVWARWLFMHELYRRALDVHGVAMEFGNRWGQNLALFAIFRGIYEPFNYTRKIVGFDTFAGFPSVAPQDGSHDVMEPGAYGVAEGWEDVLEEILAYHEAESPISHIRKFELVKGDVSTTVPDYLERHPETIVALAYFDLDIYEPTRDALVALRPHLTQGSIIGFDEACFEPMPGETIAIKEALGLSNIRLQRLPYSPTASFLVWGE